MKEIMTPECFLTQVSDICFPSYEFLKKKETFLIDFLKVLLSYHKLDCLYTLINDISI